MGFRFRFNATTLAWLSGLLLANTGSAQQLDQLRSAVEEIRLHNDQPSPTPTPNPLLVRGDSEGRKRQLFSTGNASPTGLGTTTFSITQAPDKTCGFLSGAAGVPITCGNGKPCAWETQYVGAIYCGWESTDRPKLRCIERSIATNSASCDNVCQLNVYYLLCTNATEPYCGTFAFPNGVKSYRCATETQLSASSVSFRYNNEPVCLRPFTTTILGDDITSTINTCATSTSRITTSGPSTSTPAPPSTSEPISPGSSSVSPTSTNSAVPSGGDSSNTGAIVGGVVGGVAVLGLIGLGAFFLIRRSRRNSANGNNNIQQVQQPPSGPYPSDPKFYGGQGPPGSPGQQPAMGEGFYATGPSPTTTYDPTFKSQYGSVSVDPNMPPPTAVSQTFSQHPGQHHPSLSTATSQDFGSINRASYASTGAPPVYQPPLTQQQQPLVNQPMSAIHEIGSGEDHHRGTLHEVQ